MLNELEEFLRRAAQRALEAQQKQLAQQQMQRAPAPSSPAPTSARPAPARLVPQGEVVDAELLEQPNRIAQSVQQHMRASSQVGQHASQLGERVGLADENM